MKKLFKEIILYNIKKRRQLKKNKMAKFNLEQLYKLQKKANKKFLKYQDKKYEDRLYKINREINKMTGPEVPVLPSMENINKVIELNTNIKKQKRKEQIQEVGLLGLEKKPKIPRFFKEEEEEDSDSDSDDEEDDINIKTDCLYDRLKIELIKDWVKKNQSRYNLEYNRDFIEFLMSFFVMDNVKEKNVLEMTGVSRVEDIKRLYNIHLNKRYEIFL